MRHILPRRCELKSIDRRWSPAGHVQGRRWLCTGCGARGCGADGRGLERPQLRHSTPRVGCGDPGRPAARKRHIRGYLSAAAHGTHLAHTRSLRDPAVPFTKSAMPSFFDKLKFGSHKHHGESKPQEAPKQEEPTLSIQPHPAVSA